MHPVYTGKGILEKLPGLLAGNTEVFILTDDNTQRYCLPLLEKYITGYQLINIPPGEENKSLKSLSRIWDSLLEYHAGRDAVLINLGGGMITDIGGMAAATYKRGIRFIHVPTSLLAMVDAAVGGKTGINYGGIKNPVGTFSMPAATLIDPVFLDTLPFREMLSGMAEILKYALIRDSELWNEMPEAGQIPRTVPLRWIERSVRIKKEIVSEDPGEAGLRKVLNFGHTAGDALEILYRMMHGEAVAAGMLVALRLSEMLLGFPQTVAREITHRIKLWYRQSLPESPGDIHPGRLWERMRNDKKNTGGEVRFVLLEDVGAPVWNRRVTYEEFSQALRILFE